MQHSKLSLLLLATSSAVLSVSAQTTHEILTTDAVEYVPNSLSNVSVGDTIRVTFSKANEHDVVSGSWDTPCEFNSSGGVSSGIYEKGEVFSFVVNDTSPQIFFCSEGMHCGFGMAFAVNPSGNLTVESYQTLAKGKETIRPTVEHVGGILEANTTSSDMSSSTMMTMTASPSATETGSMTTMTPSSTMNASASATPTGASAASGFGANLAMIGAVVVGGMAFGM